MSGNLYELWGARSSQNGKPRKGAGEEKDEPRSDGSSVEGLDGVGNELDVTSLVVGDLGDSLSNPRNNRSVNIRSSGEMKMSVLKE